MALLQSVSFQILQAGLKDKCSKEEIPGEGAKSYYFTRPSKSIITSLMSDNNVDPVPIYSCSGAVLVTLACNDVICELGHYGC